MSLKIAVLGGGAIGLAFAAHAILSGFETSILARTRSVELLGRDGLQVTGAAGDHIISPERFRVADAAVLDADGLDVDLLVVATKTHQLGDALRAVFSGAAERSRPAAILLLQNGWGWAEEARSIVPSGVAIYSGVMMIGIERLTETQVRINGIAGPVRMGSLFAAPLAPLRQLSGGGPGLLPTLVDEDVRPVMLSKLAFNCCMNATGALTGMTYGELVTEAAIRPLMIALADEILRILDAAQLFRPARSGADYLDRVLTPTVMPKAASHRSSMLQDLAAGRRTEIDHLNGAILAMAGETGLPAPANEAVTALIRSRRGP